MVRRQGYTLIELMLVLGLIVVAASFTFPLANALLSSNNTAAAQDQVRAALVKARSQAMAEGRAYLFQIMLNGGSFKIEPAPDSELNAQSEERPLVKEAQLPEGVIFVEQKEALYGSSTPPAGSGSYTETVVFSPDGTASQDVLLVFGIPGEGARAIRIRGLTGSIQQFDLNAPEAP